MADVLSIRDKYTHTYIHIYTHTYIHTGRCISEGIQMNIADVADYEGFSPDSDGVDAEKHHSMMLIPFKVHTYIQLYNLVHIMMLIPFKVHTTISFRTHHDADSNTA
jgi:hypothetical protein